MGVLKDCEPKKVFEFFEYLSSVPHGSGNTKAISDLCVRFAQERGLRVLQDAVNNIVIYKPASAGFELAEPIILQGHLDMVCAKTADCTVDMKTQPVRLKTDGEWIWAEKTSLGGDNLVAIALVLAILDDNTLQHPALEAVFTVDEETGMDGAKALNPSVLSGRKLINIDSEEEGVVTVGCAGGVRMNCVLPVRRETIDADAAYFTADISGLLGGHSGADIDKGRASSHQLMSRFLYRISSEMQIRLCAMDGGTLDNVIPNHTQATFAVPKGREASVQTLAAQYQQIFSQEYAAADPGVCLTLTDAAAQSAVCEADSKKTIQTLLLSPYGVQEMSMDLPGLVQTSLNMGPLHLGETELRFSYALRSSIASQKQMLVERVTALIDCMGGKAETVSPYPGWAYRKDSPLRDLFCEIYREQTGKQAAVFATHGGLECGLFCDKIPKLDCISVGPDMKDIHSVHERLHVASTARLYKIVCEMLKRSK